MFTWNYRNDNGIFPANIEKEGATKINAFSRMANDSIFNDQIGRAHV